MAKKEDDKKEKVEVSSELQKIIDQISELNVLQLSELVEALEDKFGVTAAAPVAAVAAGATEQNNGREEKDAYNVVLKSDGGQKIPVIKALRKIKADLGLKEAKELVDQAPSAIEEDVDKDKAEEIKKELEEAGAEVELQ